MQIRKIPFNEISEEHIKKLVASGAYEDSNLELKQQPYGKSDSDKKELLKDITGFANGLGGDLIIGISENNGQASDIISIEPATAELELQRIENIIGSGVEPRIPNLRMKVLDIEGKNIIIIRILKSPGAPHRVSFQNQNRFFIRRNQSVTEATVDELRLLFLREKTNTAALRDFSNNRMKAIDEFYHEKLPTKKDELAYFYYHITTDRMIENRGMFNIEYLHENWSSFLPTWSHGGNFRINADGLLLETERYNHFGYTQVFRDGAIECASIDFFNIGSRGENLNDAGFLTIFTEKYLPTTLYRQINTLIKEESDGSIYLQCGIKGAKGRSMVFPTGHLSRLDSIMDRNLFITPEVVLFSFERNDIQEAIQKLMNFIWNGFGYKQANPVNL